jgi:putative membrane protein
MARMMVSTRGSVLALLMWQWKKVVVFVVVSSLIYYLHHHHGLGALRLPTTPMAVLGAALGIFVSFRTNSAYDRWWEGRRLWGQLVNASRLFATQVLAYLPRGEDGKPTPEQRALVKRHVAYIHVLRCALRDQAPLEDEAVRRSLDEDEQRALGGEPSLGHALLHAQLMTLGAIASRGDLHELRLTSLDRTVSSLLDAQGGCERIKRTPMPRGYGFIAERLIVIFGCLFPLSLVAELGWVVIPLNVIVSLSFALISEAGRVLEDPFTMFWNGLPLSSMSTMIEINLRARLGDAELPAPVPVSPQGVLM